MAKTERLRLFCWRELESLEEADEAKRRFVPKNWEREERVKEEEGREERSRKGVGERGVVGLL